MMSLIVITVSSVLSTIAFDGNCRGDTWTIIGDSDGCHRSNGEYILQCENVHDCDIRLNASLLLGVGVYSAKIKAVQSYQLSTQFYLFSDGGLNSIGFEFLGKHISNGQTKILTRFSIDDSESAFVTVNWDASQHFHTYQIQIDENSISWIFDDVIYRTLNYNTFYGVGSITLSLTNTHSTESITTAQDFAVMAGFKSIQWTKLPTITKRRLITDEVYRYFEDVINRNYVFVHFLFIFGALLICMLLLYLSVMVARCCYKGVKRETQNSSMYCDYGTNLHEFPITVAYVKILILIITCSFGIVSAVMSKDHGFVWYFFVYDLLKLPVNILAFFALWGLVIIPRSEHMESGNFNDKVMIIFRWVTRGTTPRLIHSAIETNWPILKPYKNTKMEILTETKLNIDPSIYGIPQHRFAEVHTPKSFKTKNKTLFKARGLHNGALNSPFATIKNCYIFHCDEESLLTDSLLIGAKRFVTNNYGRIGQGQKSYKNEEYTLSSYLCHMIDSSRCGYDASTFLCQQRVFKQAKFGFHGSFVLVPHKTEVTKETSFDNCGEYGSIAEDAWWCYLPGNIENIGWCHGTLIEDSPFTLRDIIKQRNRWFTGLYLLVKHHPIGWKKKLLLAMSLYCWALLGPFLCLTIYHLIWHGPFRIFTSYSLFTAVVNNICNMIWLTNFFTGQLLLIHKSYCEKFISFVTLPFLLPFILLIESLGVISAIVNPDRKFRLVDKEGQNIKGIDIDIDINESQSEQSPQQSLQTEQSQQSLLTEEKEAKYDESNDESSDRIELSISKSPKQIKVKKHPDYIKQKKKKKKKRDIDMYSEQFQYNINTNNNNETLKHPIVINVTLSNDQIREAFKGSQFDNEITSQSPIWTRKRMNDWYCNELSDWINSLNLDVKNKQKVVEVIQEQEINGSDLKLLDNVIDIMDIFEIRKIPAMTILNGMKNVSNKNRVKEILNRKRKSKYMSNMLNEHIQRNVKMSNILNNHIQNDETMSDHVSDDVSDEKQSSEENYTEREEEKHEYMLTTHIQTDEVAEILDDMPAAGEQKNDKEDTNSEQEIEESEEQDDESVHSQNRIEESDKQQVTVNYVNELIYNKNNEMLFNGIDKIMYSDKMFKDKTTYNYKDKMSGKILELINKSIIKGKNNNNNQVKLIAKQFNNTLDLEVIRDVHASDDGIGEEQYETLKDEYNLSNKTSRPLIILLVVICIIILSYFFSYLIFLLLFFYDDLHMFTYNYLG